MPLFAGALLLLLLQLTAVFASQPAKCPRLHLDTCIETCVANNRRTLSNKSALVATAAREENEVEFDNEKSSSSVRKARSARRDEKIKEKRKKKKKKKSKKSKRKKGKKSKKGVKVSSKKKAKKSKSSKKKDISTEGETSYY